MRHWLTIQREKGKDSSLSKFIKANPGMDITMRTLLANYLNVTPHNLQQWVQKYIMHQRGKREYLYSLVK